MKVALDYKLHCTVAMLLLNVSVFADKVPDERHVISPDSQAVDSVKSINKKGYVQIGDIKQWVTIKGDDRSNPAVLFIHGGPGNPMSCFSDALYKQWEKEFTIIHWDQRCSGKTYEANQEIGEVTIDSVNKTELTVDLLVRDGLEVVNYVREKMGKEKIVITGTSWGTVIAVRMISERPDLFHFYVGLSQLVNYDANLMKSYELALSRAKEGGDQQAVALLESFGAPPWKNPRYFGRLRKVTRKYETQVTDGPLQLEIAPEYTSEESRAAASSGEDFSFIKFVGMEGDGMSKSIALDKSNTEFKIPVYIIQGKEDLLTATEITESYYAKIAAPKKKFISVERSGHDPNYRMLEVQLNTFRNAFNELAKGSK